MIVNRVLYERPKDAPTILQCVGSYQMNRPSHVHMLKNEIEARQISLEHGYVLSIIVVEIAFDEKALTSTTTIVEEHHRHPPEVMELNVAAKKTRKRAVKKTVDVQLEIAPEW
jgi:hypothetical protein